ncbi:MAG: tlpC [Bacillales bacterium]|jgi:methyl-accepting chemotaxis protein|nr:tlpC [Bacillales bacterium]
MRILQLKLATKINLLFLTSLILLSVIIAGVINYKINSSLIDTIRSKSNSDLKLVLESLKSWQEGDWELKNGDLYKGSLRINEDTTIVDKISDTTGGIATIFANETRVSTSVVVDGKRPLGTTASEEIVNEVIKKGNNYITESIVNGASFQATFAPLKDKSGNTIGMIAVGSPQEYVDKLSKDIINDILVIGTILIFLTGTLTYLYTRTIKRRLGNIATALEASGNGDFTNEVIDNTGDEITTLVESYKKMQMSLKEVVNKVSSTSERVAAASEELTAISDETSRATELIAVSISEVAESSDVQVKHTLDVKKSGSEIANHLENILINANNVNKLSVDSTGKVDVGAIKIENTIRQVNEINDKNLTTATVISNLEIKSKEIGNILKIITEIADQTNLLALNAAIEAARAGEHGRGFAVVAAEVRKLAEQSSLSANQIRNLITEIQGEIGKSVRSMDEGRVAIQEGIKMAQEAGDSFSVIKSSIGSVTNRINEVTQSIDNIKSENEMLLSKVNDVFDLVEDNSTSTENIAASAEEQNASMQEINASSQALSSLAEDLHVLISKFKF